MWNRATCYDDTSATTPTFYLLSITTATTTIITITITTNTQPNQIEGNKFNQLPSYDGRS